MSSQRDQLQAAISALEMQRRVLGDAVVDASVRALRAQLSPDPASTDSAQALKQVTILFLDVVGSTSLAQRLDPEAIGEVMDGALSRLTALVDQHGGKVLQYAGDSILAAFGANEASEDDAERAVRCGLAMISLGKVLGAEVQAALGHAGFDVRIGIHSGDVLLGGGVDEDRSIRGSAVNVAARMEQSAPAGRVRISKQTHALVRGLFDFEPQEPLTVKGIDEQVQSYLVVAARPQSFRDVTRGIEGVSTRMVARDAELQLLRDAFRRLGASRESRPQLEVVIVAAEAGIGKSRLLREFEAWLRSGSERVHLIRGQANPQTQGQPFGLLRDIVARRLQIADDESIEVARNKVEAEIVPLFLADDGPDRAQGHAHVLGHLIGIDWTSSRHVKGVLDDAKQIRNRAFHVAAQWLRRISAADGNPVLLELEDLHWADNESLDFIDYLAQVDRDVALLVLGSTRPMLFERRSDWTNVERVHQRIDLAPLDRTGSRMLVDELLKRLPEIPPVLRELISGGAKGNPFYMEELVKMLIDQGAIEVGQVWKVSAERLLVTQVPHTLAGVLQSRLDGLPKDEKRTLQSASVIGAAFWDEVLFAIDPRARDMLPSLVDRGLVVVQPDAAVDGLRQYTFQHHLLHQVTYATVLKRSKHALHAKVAHWLSNLKGVRANDFLGVTAEHYERAGDAPHAAEYHTRAAEYAGERLGHKAVLTHVAKAMALLDAVDDPELRWRLLIVRESTLSAQGRRQEQDADLAAMEQLAEGLADNWKRAQATLRRSARAVDTDNWPEAESTAHCVIAWAKLSGSSKQRLTAMRHIAKAQLARGDINAAKALLQQILAEARQLGFRFIEAQVLTTLSVAANAQNDPLELLHLTTQSLEIYKEVGALRWEAMAQSNLSTAWLSLGELTEARRHAEQALRTVRAYGESTGELNALCTLSGGALYQGDDASALSWAWAAVETAVATKAHSWEAFALLRAGDAELALGRHSAAHEAFARALAVAQSIDDAMRHDAVAGMARVALAEDDCAAALKAIQPLLDHLAGGGTLIGTDARMVEWTVYRALAAANDPRADEWLLQVHEALRSDAEKLPPTLQYGFLHNIPHHREIRAAWARQETKTNGLPLKPRRSA